MREWIHDWNGYYTTMSVYGHRLTKLFGLFNRQRVGKAEIDHCYCYTSIDHIFSIILLSEQKKIHFNRNKNDARFQPICVPYLCHSILLPSNSLYTSSKKKLRPTDTLLELNTLIHSNIRLWTYSAY